MKLNLDHLKQASAYLASLPKESDESTQQFQAILTNNPDYIEACITNLKIQNHNLKNDVEAKKWYGIAIFGFVVLYIFSVMMTIWLNAHINDEVLDVLLATTSVNIIGLLAGVVRYLFPAIKKQY